MKLPSQSTRPTGRYRKRAFTLVELMIVMAIFATIAGLAVPMYQSAKDQAVMLVTVQEMKMIQQEIDLYQMRNGFLPNSLDELTDFGDLVDPWGNPYQYVPFETQDDVDTGKGNGKGKGNQGGGNGQKRKDKFLVPINTYYDLYSMGPDGESVSPLTAKASRDDIIRANDGEYVGLASKY